MYVGSEEGKLLAMRQYFQEVSKERNRLFFGGLPREQLPLSGKESAPTFWQSTPPCFNLEPYFFFFQGIKPPVLVFVQSKERAKVPTLSITAWHCRAALPTKSHP